MLMFLFEYVLPLISFAMAIMLFIKFWSARNLLDKDTIKMVKQVKSWWGGSQNEVRWKKSGDKKAYVSATKKVGGKIKSLMPFGLLDELDDAEVHAYIMHEDTIKVAIKLKELFGGEWKLPGMPKLLRPEPRRRDQDDVPSMST